MSDLATAQKETLARTPLHALHVAEGARMVPFAGYAMPVQYKAGIIAEHLHTREKAGLFDVSHMGQAVLSGPDAARKLERLVPADIIGLASGRQRYTQFLNEAGGIIDDLMVTRLPGEDERLELIVNAANKEADFAHLRARLSDLKLDVLDDRALMALQGPKAAAVLAKLVPGVETVAFMSWRAFDWEGTELFISRSGYTGEDGYEISVPGAQAEEFAARLLANRDVMLIGLGARDSLRLEAGLCLHGHDIDTQTSPIEAGLAWSIQKRRRQEGGFPGAERLKRELADGLTRKRVGLELAGKAPAREGAELTAQDGRVIGRVTSGGFAPSLGRPIACGYVERDFAAPGSDLNVIVRGTPLAARVVQMPFVPHRYFRG
ncbi:MAG: glycine cleavage system aminomethyltransferase GcvT [Methylobacteriaceae bacterium]|nr:glycine cleavage system aminomethyltransferase GcvT [Methylobacteriaceae bacterium]